MDPKTILVVDDEAVTRASLATLLARAGYQVMSAANGAEALQVLRAGQRPDLVLLDMIMPVSDGWAFLRHPVTAETPTQYSGCWRGTARSER
jgi:CheY-like chemotaxis protein